MVGFFYRPEAACSRTGDRTRTYTSEILDPKSSASTNSATPAKKRVPNLERAAKVTLFTLITKASFDFHDALQTEHQGRAAQLAHPGNCREHVTKRGLLVNAGSQVLLGILRRIARKHLQE